MGSVRFLIHDLEGVCHTFPFLCKIKSISRKKLAYFKPFSKINCILLGIRPVFTQPAEREDNGYSM